MRLNFITFLTIASLGFILRFYQLGTNPPSLNWDETAHGYNAYSILKTGRDEYGKRFPLYFRSFDDYKPPLYTYLVVPSVALFGLDNFAVRFPSALLGSLAVPLTFFLARELLKNHKIALLSSFFLAISPWHLQFSRVAFETNSAIFWSVLGTLAFLKGMKTQHFKMTLWLSLSATAFGANLFMYHNSRVFIPMFSLMLLVFFWKKILNSIRFLVVPILIFLIFSIILLPIAFSDAGQVRFKGTSVFGDVSPLYKTADLILEDKKEGDELIGKLVHNRRFVYVPIILENYISHFRPSFLFFSADMPRHHAPLIGLLYFWDIPFLIGGLYFLVRKSFLISSKILIFWWFLISPIASSVTWGVPHSLRSEIFLPTYQIFTAVGFYFITKKFRSMVITVIFITFLSLNLFFYLHQYYIHMPLETSKDWLYGREEASTFTESVKNNYDKIIVSIKLEQPYMFWLFNLKYDPQKYLDNGGTVSGSFKEEENSFDKYLFKSIDYLNQKNDSKTLFVALPDEFPPDAKIIKKINYLNGEPAIYIAE